MRCTRRTSAPGARRPVRWRCDRSSTERKGASAVAGTKSLSPSPWLPLSPPLPLADSAALPLVPRSAGTARPPDAAMVAPAAVQVEAAPVTSSTPTPAPTSEGEANSASSPASHGSLQALAAAPPASVAVPSWSHSSSSSSGPSTCWARSESIWARRAFWSAMRARCTAPGVVESAGPAGALRAEMFGCRRRCCCDVKEEGVRRNDSSSISSSSSTPVGGKASASRPRPSPAPASAALASGWAPSSAPSATRPPAEIYLRTESCREASASNRPASRLSAVSLTNTPSVLFRSRARRGGAPSTGSASTTLWE